MVKKRLLACALSLLMIGGTISYPVPAAAADPTALTSEGGELQSGSYELTGPLTLSENLTIPAGAEVTLDLKGSTLTGNGTGSVITIENGASLTLTDSGESGTVTGGNSASGGGIYNNGTLLMTGGTVTDNTAQQGGGIYSSGSMTLQNVDITDNSATGKMLFGGGISIGAADDDVKIENCTITGNTAVSGGGGIAYVDSDSSGKYVRITDCIVTDNSAQGGVQSGGGGILTYGNAAVSNCYITDNTAGYSGGGVAFGPTPTLGITPSLMLSNSIIQKNSAGTYGGGIVTSSIDSLTISGGSVTGNTSANGGGIAAVLTGFTLTDGGVIANNTASTGGDDVYFMYKYPGIEMTGNPLTLPSPSSFGIDGVAQWFEDAPDMRYEGNETVVARYDSFTEEKQDHYLSAGQIFTVTFDSRGGSQTAPRFAADGHTISEPPAPTLEKYIFTGWFTDEAAEASRFDFSTPITDDLTLYAGWERDFENYPVYTLTYESNGGTVYDVEEYEGGTTVTLDKEPARNGYTFTGWYADSDLTQKIDSILLDDNKTVYAGWEEYTEPCITIEFDTRGGTPAPDPVVIPYSCILEDEDGSAYYEYLNNLEPVADPQLPGYDFSYWSFDYIGTGIEDDDPYVSSEMEALKIEVDTVIESLSEALKSGSYEGEQLTDEELQNLRLELSVYKSYYRTLVYSDDLDDPFVGLTETELEAKFDQWQFGILAMPIESIPFLFLDGIDDLPDDGYTVTLHAEYEKDSSPVYLGGTVNITPADLTIYTGGAEGSGAYVTENETGSAVISSDFPRPLFHVSVTDGSDPADITVNGENGQEWTFEAANSPAENGETLYYIVPQNQDGTQEPVRVQYTDGNGSFYTDDDFDPAQAGTSMTLNSELYMGDVNLGKVTAQSSDETPYALSAGQGTLTVRVVVGEQESAISQVLKEGDEITLSYGEIAAVAAEGTTFTVNSTTVPVDDDSQISLLADDICEKGAGPDTGRTAALESRAEEITGVSAENAEHESKYLDLVDVKNGNAWVTPSEDITVYWAYPEGTDSSTEFTLLHFAGLHRDNPADTASGILEWENVEKIPVTNTEDGIAFTVGAGGFSPFVLTWEKESEPEVPSEPTNPPSDAENPGGGAGNGGANTDTGNAAAVQTGDTLNTTPMILVLLISAGTSLAMILYRRRFQK